MRALAIGIVLASTGAFVGTSAYAQSPGDWIDIGQVLAPDPALPWMSESVSSPTVVWDSVNSRYIMVFESRHSSTDSRCPVGIWSMGAATSTDGTNWTVRTTPLLEPTPGDGTYYSCVAAHPTAIFNPAGNGGNGTMIVHFKGEQDDDACAGGGAVPTWGCGQFTGIGRMKVDLKASGNIDKIKVITEPSVPVAVNMGYPSAVRVGGDWSMALGQYPDIYMAQGPDLNSLVLGAAPVLEAVTYSPLLTWMDEEFYSPAMLCEPGALPYKMYIGGRDDDGTGTVTNAGWSSALSADALSWSVTATPYFTWANSDEYRHLEGLTSGASDYLLYYAERDTGTSVNKIRMMATDVAFVPGNTGSKNCP